MEFDIEKDLVIFEEIFKSRPTIDREKFKLDLKNYYLPYLDKLLKLQTPAIVGVSAIQGAGKTTQGEILEILLKKFGKNSVHLSIDDHYITHQQLCELREKDPRYIRRGVTHDIPLAIRNLKDLKNMQSGQVVLVAEYDKGLQKGDGDRFRWINPVPGLLVKGVVEEKVLTIDKEMLKTQVLTLTAAKFNDLILNLPEDMGSDLPLLEEFLPKPLVEFLEANKNGAITISVDSSHMIHFSNDGEVIVAKEDLPKGWRLVDKKPDFIFYDGWMLGARSVSDESVFSSGLPALETPEAQEFAKMINKKLLDYEELWSLFEFLTVLYVPDYKMALVWREDAEKPLQAKGEGMNPEQIKEFVYYFWRSVHPAIQIKNLAHDEKSTNQVAIIADDHAIVEVLTPVETKEKYP